MKARSPVVGYNHNVRHGGRVWHVQTEDSGVQNPHIFTHLFNGGTIIGSKKTNYDAESDVAAVQKLMQTQHKLMLRDLKGGAFDDKIEKVFGPIVREPADGSPQELETQRDLELRPDVAPMIEVPQPEVAAQPARSSQVHPVAPLPPAVVPLPPAVAAVPQKREDERKTVPNLAPLHLPPAAQPPTAPRSMSRPQARLTQAPRPSVVTARSGTSPPPTPAPPPTIGGSRGAPPPTIGSGRAGAPQQSVVVSRPSVIVGGGQKKGDSAQFWKTNERRPEPGFGENVISERSLDEVILAYLSEDAPKK